MTIAELQREARATFGNSARVMHAASNDGRTVGAEVYDLHATTADALQLKLAVLTAHLRAQGWTT